VEIMAARREGMKKRIKDPAEIAELNSILRAALELLSKQLTRNQIK
jgi:hypothetical protein